MTEQQKRDILQLRSRGLAFSSIAKELSLSVNTVKSFCRRKTIKAVNEPSAVCRFCGKHLIQTFGKREKKYCSDKCRTLWWNNNRRKMDNKSVSFYKCSFCGKMFIAYPSAYN